MVDGLKIHLDKIKTQHLTSYQKLQNFLNRNSSIVYLVEDDFYRRIFFENIDFIDKNLVLNSDFNMRGTIELGIKLTATKQLMSLMDFIFEFHNISEYNDFIMLDLFMIIECNKIQIPKFFSRSEQDKSLNLNSSSQVCCLETLLTNQDLPLFSTVEKRHQLHEDVNIFLEEKEQQLC